MKKLNLEKSKSKKLEHIAKREHIATDMGNGGSYCSNCRYDLGSEPSVNYENCPGCGFTLKEGSVYSPVGGSDF